jgi:excisionase family DNA binding protein
MMRQRVARLSELIQQEWYTAEETSDLLGLSPDLVRRAVANGRLPATIDEEESVQIRHADLVVWLQRRPYAAWVAEF